MPKFAFLLRDLEIGGAQRQAVVLARGLRARGHSVTVYLFYNCGPFREELEDAGIEVIGLEKRGRWDLLSVSSRLVRNLTRSCPDAVLSYLSSPNLLLALISPFLGRTQVVWGLRASGLDLRKYEFAYRVSLKVEQLLSRGPALIVLNSEAGKRFYVEAGFHPANMVVIPNGIDVSRFRPDSEAGERVRLALGISKEERVVGLIGRLDPMKGQEVFLHAAASLLRTRRNIRFVSVGSGPRDMHTGLQRLTEELGIQKSVVWADADDAVVGVYNALDLLVSASFGEGFSNVIAEAMACGVPCVVTDVGDSALIVKDLGLVVPPGDPVLLAAAITQILDSPQWRNRGTECRSRITTEFSIVKLVERTEQELRRVCGSPSDGENNLA